MSNNITRADLDALIAYLQQDSPMLTQSKQVVAFEKEWSEWLGCKHSVFVNSGASANLLTISALKHTAPAGEIIVPTLTWVSDIASVLQCGFKPVFVDIDPRTLGMDTDEVIRKITPQTRAVFLTHILGYNALNQKLLDALADKKIPLIEDACESHGATFKGRKVGSFGLISNFSFYYAHHMSTVEGGMICTNDSELFEILRMLRSHGMVRESTSDAVKTRYKTEHADLNPDFIFAYPAYNVRSTEINAVLGRAQLKRLDTNNAIRTANLKRFLSQLDSEKYFTDFELEGSSNYAFTLVMKNADKVLYENLTKALREMNVEFRRGTSGGGNQLRQPYLKKVVGENECRNYPKIDHVHFYGFYIGNYPELDARKIDALCAVLNSLEAGN